MVAEKDLLIDNNTILDVSHLWEQSIMDIYFDLHSDTDSLLEFLKDLANKLDLPNGTLVREPVDPYSFLDIYSDYYNEERIEVDLALMQEGFYTDAKIVEITLSELLSVKGISSDNLHLFIKRILAAHLNEYGY